MLSNIENLKLCEFMFEIRIFKKQKNNIISHHYMQKVHPKNKNTEKTRLKLSNLRLCSIGEHTHSWLSKIIIALGR